MLGGLLVVAFFAPSPPRPPHPASTSPMPLDIAHGGAQAHAPSDTTAAFDLALEMGADVLEMNAQLTADDRLVVRHDGTVDRQTDGTGAIADMTVAELQGHDAGYALTVNDEDELPDRAPAGDAHDGQLDLIRWLQDRLGWLTPVMLLATFLGDADFYLLIFPLIYWSVSRRIGLRVGVMLLLSAGVNGVLKLGSASPRPFYLDPDVGLVDETTFGIPSGHAQNAVAVWGTVAAELGRRWAWIAAIALMLVLGWSRIHLGAHFPIDTLTGWAVGAVLLLAYLRWRDPVAGWLASLRAGPVLWIAFATSLLLIGVGAVVRTSFTGWSVPAAWVGAGEAGLEGGATGLSTVVTPSAALFGLAVGGVLLHRRGGFDTDGPLWARVLRYPVGLVGMVILWQGLDAVLPDGETVAALAARYVRYALIGAWAIGGAPLVFRWLRLAPAAPVQNRVDAAVTDEDA